MKSLTGLIVAVALSLPVLPPRRSKILSRDVTGGAGGVRGESKFRTTVGLAEKGIVYSLVTTETASQPQRR